MAGEGVRARRVAGAVADPDFPALKARVIARTGHTYYDDKDDLLFDRLRKRFQACGLADSRAYLARLEGPGGREEWIALEAEITIGETFFFRYAEQFAALRTTILPGLIAARAGSRSLRIWSAGCSTGAEPYSIAILLHELLGPALPGWTVNILGTDISAAALATARAAEFGPWALRTMPAEERDRYFRRTAAAPGRPQGGYALRPAYRRMVRFERRNLLALIDGSGVPIPPCDLILCRNVLIYFSAAHVQAIVRALAGHLGPDGWLLLGHAEPNPEFATFLEPLALPGTVAYRPLGGETPATAPPILPDPPPSLPPAPPPREETDAESGDILPPSRMPEPPPAPPVEPVPEETADEPAADALARIRALADAGRTGEAWRRIQAAARAHPTTAALRYYEGLLAHHLGREAEAERALRGALFLDRGYVMAHYQLGLLLLASGRRDAAARALGNAVRLARGLAPATPLPEGDGLRAGELIDNARLAVGGPR